MTGPTTEAALRERLAERFRDWLHESPMSKCGLGSDTCADWDVAYELADLALRERPSNAALVEALAKYHAETLISNECAARTRIAWELLDEAIAAESTSQEWRERANRERPRGVAALAAARPDAEPKP